ncbi:hypothetical protein pb186bvf_002430 [Paramecium bursaria]
MNCQLFQEVQAQTFQNRQGNTEINLGYIQVIELKTKDQQIIYLTINFKSAQKIKKNKFCQEINLINPDFSVQLGDSQEKMSKNEQSNKRYAKKYKQQVWMTIQIDFQKYVFTFRKYCLQYKQQLQNQQNYFVFIETLILSLENFRSNNLLSQRDEVIGQLFKNYSQQNNQREPKSLVFFQKRISKQILTEINIIQHGQDKYENAIISQQQRGVKLDKFRFSS